MQGIQRKHSNVNHIHDKLVESHSAATNNSHEARQWEERQCMTLRLCVAGFDVVTVPDGQRGEKIYIVSLFNPALACAKEFYL